MNKLIIKINYQFTSENGDFPVKLYITGNLSFFGFIVCIGIIEQLKYTVGGLIKILVLSSKHISVLNFLFQRNNIQETNREYPLIYKKKKTCFKIKQKYPSGSNFFLHV